ncbi:uncharacterized protein BP5553_04863 [Venustampulla echinocandica]|uniref:Uncharacterized protein n=1 Tax=Venustampulla echinocandica TaxID=2656787 RepID=A0A370TPI3_9HELO|nr:uncharacterized protein BP5553_04863 [Venustampulla echinocandica]RDL37430.1 hypothetical protein BP5553_04863 [Venustampulla echinocandica]
MHSSSVLLVGALAAQAMCLGVTPYGGIVQRYAAPLAVIAMPAVGMPLFGSVESREPVTNSNTNINDGDSSISITKSNDPNAVNTNINNGKAKTNKTGNANNGGTTNTNTNTNNGGSSTSITKSNDPNAINTNINNGKAS